MITACLFALAGVIASGTAVSAYRRNQKQPPPPHAWIFVEICSTLRFQPEEWGFETVLTGQGTCDYLSNTTLDVTIEFDSVNKTPKLTYRRDDGEKTCVAFTKDEAAQFWKARQDGLELSRIGQ